MVDIQANETASLHSMSSNVVDIMQVLSQNMGIRTLLYINDAMPFHPKHQDKIPTPTELMSPKSNKRRIYPVSFNMNAQLDDRTEIRVYYNVGRFDSSGKHIDYNMHIDIICAKDLWLIQDHVKQKSLIRPYEIMSRIVDSTGKHNYNGINLGAPVQFQMLSVNEKFDALRIYYNTNDIVGDTNSIREN